MTDYAIFRGADRVPEWTLGGRGEVVGLQAQGASWWRCSGGLCTGVSAGPGLSARLVSADGGSGAVRRAGLARFLPWDGAASQFLSPSSSQCSGLGIREPRPRGWVLLPSSPPAPALGGDRGRGVGQRSDGGGGPFSEGKRKPGTRELVMLL